MTLFEISEDDKIIAKINFDEDEFSKSEIECLDNSIDEHLSKSFWYLTDKSHDAAWKDAIYSMDNIKIAKAGGADENMVKYIMHYNELINSKFM